MAATTVTRWAQLLHRALERDGVGADRLHLSPRTLQRRLRDEGTCFRSILDDARRELAIRYLTERDLSINEITYMLGFVEPSSFTRAFKRWTGSCPTAFREAARGA